MRLLKPKSKLSLITENEVAVNAVGDGTGVANFDPLLGKRADGTILRRKQKQTFMTWADLMGMKNLVKKYPTQK